MSSSRITSGLGVVATTALMLAGAVSADWTFHHADTATYNTMVKFPDCNSKESILAYLANEVYYGKHPMPDKSGKFKIVNGKIYSDYGQWQVPCDASKPIRDPAATTLPTIICSPTFVTGNNIAWNYQDRAMVCIVKSKCPVPQKKVYIGPTKLSDITPGLTAETDKSGIRGVGTVATAYPLGPKFFHGATVAGYVPPANTRNDKLDYPTDPNLPKFKYPKYKQLPVITEDSWSWGEWPQTKIETSGCGENECAVLEGEKLDVIELGSYWPQDGEGENFDDVHIADFSTVDECINLLTGKSLFELTADAAFDPTTLLQACGGHDLVTYGEAATGLAGADAELQDKANPNYNGIQDFDYDWETNADWQIENQAYDSWVKSKDAKLFWATCGERFVIFSGTDDNQDYVKNKSTFGDWKYGIKWHYEWVLETDQYWNWLDLNVATPMWKHNGDLPCVTPQANKYDITFAGHSQGAAVAHIAAAMYINIVENKGGYAETCRIGNVQPDYPEHIAITTFGQPPHIKNWDYNNYAPYRQLHKGNRIVGMKLTCLRCVMGVCAWGQNNYDEMEVGGSERKLIDMVADVAWAVSPYNHNPTIATMMVAHDNVVDWTRYNKDVGCRTQGDGPVNVWGYPNLRGNQGGYVSTVWNEYATKTVKLHSSCDMYLPSVTIAAWNSYYHTKLASQKKLNWGFWSGKPINYKGEPYCFNCAGATNELWY